MMNANDEAINNFIDSWGMMGSVWGVNPSTARVHAFLIVSEKPVSLDDISSKLKISRGNASMCLKELRNWGVIRLIKEHGDRRNYYVSESEAWNMFFAIAKERKRREFDPLVQTVEYTLATLKEDKTWSKGEASKRLNKMEEFLKTLQFVSDRLLLNNKMAHSVLPVLMRLAKQGK